MTSRWVFRGAELPIFGAYQLEQIEVQCAARHFDVRPTTVFQNPVHLEASSLFLFGVDHPVRRRCISLMYAAWFRRAILVVILLNALSLCLRDRPLQRVVALQEVLKWTDFTVIIVFVAEAVVKIVALGLLLHPKSYLRNPWNVLDIVVVLFGIQDLATFNADALHGDAFTALRVVRVFRPLRSLSYIPALRQLVNRMLRCLPDILNVGILTALLVWFMAALGLQVFDGAFDGRCFADITSIANDSDLMGCIASPVVDAGAGGVFALLDNDTVVCGLTRGRPCSPSLLRFDTSGCSAANGSGVLPADGWLFAVQCRAHPDPERVLNYDNIVDAMLISFKVICKDSWPEDLNRLANGVGLPSAALYMFVSTMLVGYLCVNFFTAIFESSFSSLESSLRLGEALFDMERTAAMDASFVPPAPRFTTVAGAVAVSPAAMFACGFRPDRINVEEDTDRSAGRLLHALSDLASRGGRESSEQDALRVAYRRELPDVLREDQVSKWRRFKRVCRQMLALQGFAPARRIVQSAQYNAVVLLVVLVNASALASSTFPENPDRQSTIHWLSFASGVFFVLDAVLKLSGLGPAYFYSKWNMLDLVLCFATLPQMAVGAGSPLQPLRTLRMLQLLKLGHRWTSLRKLLFLIGNSVASVLSVAAIGLLVMFSYALFGFELFGVDIPGMRFSFATIPEAFLSVFTAVTGENPGDMSAALAIPFTRWSCLYFVTLTIFGNFIWSNLFVAVILDQFALTDDRIDRAGDLDALLEQDGDAFLERIRSLFARADATNAPTERGDDWRKGTAERAETPPALAERLLSSAIELRRVNGDDCSSDWCKAQPSSPYEQADATTIAPTAASGGPSKRKRGASTTQPTAADLTTDAASPLYVSPSDSADTLDHLQRTTDAVVHPTERSPQRTPQRRPAERRFVTTDNHNHHHDVPTGSPLAAVASKVQTKAEASLVAKDWGGVTHVALWLSLPPSHVVRRWCIAVSMHPAYDVVSLIVTLSSSVLLALDVPGQASTRSDALSEAIEVTDAIFCAVFLLEMVVKIVALGFVRHTGAYLRSPWNVIDAVVSVSALSALFFSPLKWFRSLRVLRLLNVSFTLRVIVRALVSAIPQMGAVLVFLVLLFAIWAVVGLELFRGKFYACNDPSVYKQAACVGSYNTSYPTALHGNVVVTASRLWGPSWPHSTSYDAFFPALYALFKLANTDEWFRQMYQAIDADGTNSVLAALYFISFMIVGKFFGVQLFIGVLVDRFVLQRQRGEGYGLLTEAQSQWVLIQKVLLRVNLKKKAPRPTGHYVRAKAFDMVTHPVFDVVFTTITVGNAVVVSLYGVWGDASDAVLDTIGLVIVGLFAVELTLRLFATGPRQFFRRQLNCLDVLIVGGSIAVLPFANASAPVVRVFRALRLITVFRRHRGIRIILDTFYHAVPEFLNVAMLLLSLFFVFAVIGVQLFHAAPQNDDGVVNENVNFEDVPHAMLALYLMMSGEWWSEITDVVHEVSSLAIPFSICFMMLAGWVGAQLLVTVVIDVFGETEETVSLGPNIAVMDDLRQLWSSFDPHGARVLHCSTVVRHIFPRLSERVWDRTTAAALMMRKKQYLSDVWTPFLITLRQLEQMHLPIDADRRCRYDDCLASVAMRLFSIPVAEAIAVSQQAVHGVTWSADNFCAHHEYAAQLLTRNVRRFLKRRRLGSRFSGCSSTAGKMMLQEAFDDCEAQATGLQL